MGHLHGKGLVRASDERRVLSHAVERLESESMIKVACNLEVDYKPICLGLFLINLRLNLIIEKTTESNNQTAV